MSDDAVFDLARAAGLAVDWTDASGAAQRVDLGAARAILSSLGYPASTPPEIAESHQRLQGSKEAIPPLVTVTVGEKLALPATARPANGRGELVLESGEVLPLRFVVRGQRAVGPAMEQVGYHRLRLADREITVAVAPPRCLTLAQRGDGRRLWGISTQIYALRRKGDGGIGDASAVRQLAEAAAGQGADAVALSPVHSLFAADPGLYSPYSPSSRLFLNPLLADPAIVFGEERVARHRVDGAALESAALIDWPAASSAKFTLFRRLFDDFEAHDIAAATALAADFVGFVEAGGEALQDHATFEMLHAQWRGATPPRSDWRSWLAQSAEDVERAGASSVRYHLFLQWIAARSFEAAQKTATEAGMRIGLMADLAIGMDPQGSHAWSRQADLLLGLSIGAPPDAFNRSGQNWGLVGFSPYALVANGFEPFLATVRAAMRYAGGVRIDHVMGLQRLWLIPHGAPPAQGAYLRYPLGDLLRLLALESHRHGAVVIGEDLGTVPPGFRPRLRKAGVAGMDVMWFMRTRSSFHALARWRPDAVSMTTTHDLPTVAGWWRGADIATRQTFGLAGEDEPEGRRHDRRRLWQAFRRAGVALEKTAPPDDAPDAAVDAALAFVAASPAPLMLAPVEDLLGLSDQPNLPGTIDQHPNWRRRLAPLAADLLHEPQAARRAALIGRYRT